MESKDVEFWRTKANDYECLYREQKDIGKGYKKIIDEYRLIMGIDKPEEKDVGDKNG
jgi:hypothetical protein